MSLAPGSERERRHLRATLRGTQQVLCTGCPSAFRSFCQRSAVSPVCPNLWRVRNLPVRPETAVPWAQWCAALFRCYGYCASSEPTGAVLVGYADAHHRVPKQSDPQAALEALSSPPPGSIRVRNAADAASWLRLGDLLPAVTAFARLQRSRRDFLAIKASQWLPPIKACLLQCLDELWAVCMKGPVPADPAHRAALVLPILHQVVRQQRWPSDVSAHVFDVREVWPCLGRVECAGFRGGPVADPRWWVAVVLALRTVVPPRVAEEPGLRSLVAHQILEDVVLFCERRQCVCVSPPEGSPLDTSTPVRVILLSVWGADQETWASSECTCVGLATGAQCVSCKTRCDDSSVDSSATCSDSYASDSEGEEPAAFPGSPPCGAGGNPSPQVAPDSPPSI